MSQQAATDMPAAPAATVPASAPAAAPRRRKRSPRRFIERLFLGSIMTLIAIALDRRLRRVFSKR